MIPLRPSLGSHDTVERYFNDDDSGLVVVVPGSFVLLLAAQTRHRVQHNILAPNAGLPCPERLWEANLVAKMRKTSTQIGVRQPIRVGRVAIGWWCFGINVGRTGFSRTPVDAFSRSIWTRWEFLIQIAIGMLEPGGAT